MASRLVTERGRVAASVALMQARGRFADFPDGIDKARDAENNVIILPFAEGERAVDALDRMREYGVPNVVIATEVAGATTAWLMTPSRSLSASSTEVDPAMTVGEWVTSMKEHPGRTYRAGDRELVAAAAVSSA